MNNHWDGASNERFVGVNIQAHSPPLYLCCGDILYEMSTAVQDHINISSNLKSRRFLANSHHSGGLPEAQLIHARHMRKQMKKRRHLCGAQSSAHESSDWGPTCTDGKGATIWLRCNFNYIMEICRDTWNSSTNTLVWVKHMEAEEYNTGLYTGTYVELLTEYRAASYSRSHGGKTFTSKKQSFIQ